ncbi:MAG: hypothetical protein CMI18_06085 [Opitutaceae bacterium]|nr:hypothetical protein [Opitutaceae bacterium]
MEACAVGEHIPQAFLRVRRIEGDQTEYLIIRMENILITSVSTGGSGGEDCLRMCLRRSRFLTGVIHSSYVFNFWMPYD